MADTFIPSEIINRKRRGESLPDEVIHEIVDRYYRGALLPQQMAAFAMAVCLQKMNARETSALTQAMWKSGKTLRWEPGRPKVDKHSTGGIGDKISLALAPLLACLGMDVPMISGRGLDFTGGTLDKLESIPGYRTDLSLDQFQQIATHVGCAITGATAEMAPADQLLYNLRNETGTVESVALITASVLSKKLAAGLDALILDVKFGTGAFMEDISSARELAASLVEVGNRLGMKTRALLTDMNQPLGEMVGNDLEVIEALDVLRGEGPPDVRALTTRLACELLDMTKLETDRERASHRVNEAISSGKAYEKFLQMVAAQGGDLRQLPPPQVPFDFHAPRDGYLQTIHGRELGYALIAMGGGRRRSTDRIVPGVGFQILVRLGNIVRRGDVLARVFWNGDRHFVVERLRRAFVVGDDPVETQPLVREVLDGHATIAGSCDNQEVRDEH